MGCGSGGSGDASVRVGGDELYLAPAGESQSRVRGILPTQGSEDMSRLLDTPTTTGEPSNGDVVRDYLPDLATDWVIDIRFEGDPRLDPKRILDHFNAEWRRRYGGPTIFALDPDAGRWTFLISADGPKAVTRLKLAWDFINRTDDEVGPPQVFSEREVAVQKALVPLGVAKLKTSLGPEEAARRARWLRELKSRMDYSPTVILHAPKGKRFEGRDIWDVMLCLGLKWGDMDLFHWENKGGPGDDAFFSVWTSTSPGYFFPEAIAAGKVRVEDLVFGFSAARCSQPSRVFESMVRAVQYTQKRLGGTIADESGSDAGLGKIREKIRSVEQELESKGFTPGGESALRLF